jgi:hypothetical protein
MEWEPIVAVLIFIAGLAWNRHDGDRRERRASRAAQLAAFEQLQRDTHLEMQDALAAAYQAADKARNKAAFERRALATPLNRANVLQTRIADPRIRELVLKALKECQDLVMGPRDGLEETRKRAGDAAAAAEEALGRLVREPPSA